MEVLMASCFFLALTCIVLFSRDRVHRGKLKQQAEFMDDLAKRYDDVDHQRNEWRKRYMSLRRKVRNGTTWRGI
jgi:hypothetical protein